MSLMVDLLTIANKIELFLENSNTWDSTTAHKWTVPVGKRWFIMGGSMKRDASETASIGAFNSSDKQILALLSESAAANTKSWPEAEYYTRCEMPLILDAGEYIGFSFGGAQGAAAILSGWALEVNV